MHDSMKQCAVPSLALNCQVGYLFSETGDGSFLSINSVKNCMMYNKNRMALFVRVLILRDGEKLYVSFFW